MWACSPFSTFFLKIISAIVGGFRTVKQWISFYRPVLGPHTSCQSLGALKWPTDISLNEGLTSAAVVHRRLNTPISTRPRSPLPRHHNLPRCESPISSLRARGRAPDRAQAARRWAHGRRRISAALPLGAGRHTGSSVPPLFWLPHARH